MKASFMTLSLAFVLGVAQITPAPAQSLESAQAAFDRGDYRVALQQFQLLADRGNQQAKYALGIMHYQGTGVEKNYSQARSLFQAAAEQGMPHAQLRLGLMYANGEGGRYTNTWDVQRHEWRREGEVMLTDGYAWLALAAQSFPPGEEKDEANATRDRVGARMTARQIDAANRMASMYAERIRAIDDRKQQATQQAAAAEEKRRQDEQKRQDAARERTAALENTKPKCSQIRFAGIAVGGMPQNLAFIKNSGDVGDILARNPLSCGPNALTQTYTCSGAAYLEQEVAYILGWGEDYYQVATPLDLTRGRKDVMLFIDRQSAQCLDQKPPSTEFSANLQNFLLHHNRYR
jgi:hypothetical protein